MREFAYLIGEIAFKIVFFCGALVVNTIHWVLPIRNLRQNPISQSLEETFYHGIGEFCQGLKRIDSWSKGWLWDLTCAGILLLVLYYALGFISEEFGIYM